MERSRTADKARASSWWLAAALGVALQGCASPGKPITQTVRVETPGCAPTSCELSNDRGSWRVASTPGGVTVTTSREPLKVVCRPANGAQGSAVAGSSTAPSTGVGAVAGGVTGGAAAGAAFGAVALAFIPVLGVLIVATGVAVGAVSGQALESSQSAIGYPALVSIPMSCFGDGAAAAAPSGAPTFGVAVRGLSLAEARTAGLGERSAVLVTNVAAGSLADAAGLRSGDLVLAVDAREVGDAADLEARVLSLAPGSSLALRVWREGQPLELTLTLPKVEP